MQTNHDTTLWQNDPIIFNVIVCFAKFVFDVLDFSET